MIDRRGRTRSFKRRISIEREVLGIANEFSLNAGANTLLGLSDSAIKQWVDSLKKPVDTIHLQQIEKCIREISRATGLLSDESRCAVAESKVSSDFPELLTAFRKVLMNAESDRPV